jgi:hypothetical protein
MPSGVEMAFILKLILDKLMDITSYRQMQLAWMNCIIAEEMPHGIVLATGILQAMRMVTQQPISMVLNVTNPPLMPLDIAAEMLQRIMQGIGILQAMRMVTQQPIPMVLNVTLVQ